MIHMVSAIPSERNYQIPTITSNILPLCYNLILVIPVTFSFECFLALKNDSVSLKNNHQVMQPEATGWSRMAVTLVFFR
jgi:hypothetical protein